MESTMKLNLHSTKKSRVQIKSESGGAVRRKSTRKIIIH